MSLWILSSDPRGICCSCGKPRINCCDLCSSCTPIPVEIDSNTTNELVVTTPTGFVFKNGGVVGSINFTNGNSKLTTISNNTDYSSPFEPPYIFEYQLILNSGENVTMYCETASPSPENHSDPNALIGSVLYQGSPYPITENIVGQGFSAPNSSTSFSCNTNFIARNISYSQNPSNSVESSFFDDWLLLTINNQSYAIAIGDVGFQEAIAAGYSPFSNFGSIYAACSNSCSGSFSSPNGPPTGPGPVTGNNFGVYVQSFTSNLTQTPNPSPAVGTTFISHPLNTDGNCPINYTPINATSKFQIASIYNPTGVTTIPQGCFTFQSNNNGYIQVNSATNTPVDLTKRIVLLNIYQNGLP